MKKTVVPTLFLVFLLTLSVICVRPVKAQYQGDIAINADGSVSPSTAPIQQTGSIYSLTSNVIGSITVETNNTVLDGNEYTLSGGLSLGDVSNVTVKNFIIPYNGEVTTGISLSDTSNVVVANNTITGFESVEAWNGAVFEGISVEAGNSNIITGNSLIDNLIGIVFSDSSYNQVVKNNIEGDVNFQFLYSTGIVFEDASNNTIYHNNFTSSTTQAEDYNSINIWDDGYPAGGNYWSDYTTKYPNAGQIESSGIGDTPYVIDPQNKDLYPLIEPFTASFVLKYEQEAIPPMVSVLSPSRQIYSSGNVSLVFSIDKPVNWVGYSLDEQQNVTVTGNATITNVTSGLHSITVYANDTFGVIGSSEPVNFTVVLAPSIKPETFPTSTVALSGASATIVVGVGLFVYFFKKHRR